MADTANANNSSQASSTQLFALTLARALDLELSDTTEICLSGNASSSALTSEVRISNVFFSPRISHRFRTIAHRNRIAARWCPETSQHPQK
jgi:hypothetical protein